MSAFSSPWVRLWSDTPNDPKWRTIARVSGQMLAIVQAVYMHVLVNASNSDERGTTMVIAEDVASALDLQTEQVEAILTAMQGRVLEGARMIGWEERQPVKDDGAAERAKAYRERNRLSIETVDKSPQTLPNANERQRTVDADTDAYLNTAQLTPCGQLPACGQLPNPEPPEPVHEAPPTPAQTATTATTEPAESPQIEIFDDRHAVILAVCAALKASGVNVKSTHAKLAALVQRGADVAQFLEAANKAKTKTNRLAYLLATVEGQLDDAQQITAQAMTSAAAPWRAPARGPEYSPTRHGPDPAMAKIAADDLITDPPPADWKAKFIAQANEIRKGLTV